MPKSINAWEISVFFSRWRNRLHYVVKAPIVYRNWWEIYLLKLRSAPVVLTLRNGTKFWVRPGTRDLGIINEAVILDEYLGPELLTLDSDSVIVDVGANVGDFSVEVARRCPDGTVFAIEPVASNLRQLEMNLALNEFTNVRVIGCAVGGSNGEVSIHKAGGSSSLYWGDAETERVPMLTLESIMKSHRIDKIDLLKLDCEGAEWEILPAAEPVLPRIRQICLEYHNGELTANWLEEWLRAHEFEVRRTDGAWTGTLWAWRAT